MFSISTSLCIYLSTNRLKHAQQEIKTKESEMKKTDQEYKKDKAAYENVKKNLAVLEVNFYRKFDR